MKKSILLLIIAISANLAIAQSKLTVYSQFVIDNYKANKTERNENIKSILRSVDGTKYFDAFIGIDDKAAIEALQNAGVIVGVVTDKYITAQVPLEAIAEIEANKYVKSIAFARKARLNLDKAIVNTHHDKVLSGTDLKQAYDGTGVVYGTLDAGIDFNHANFRNEDGSTRIIAAYLPSDNSGSAVYGDSFNSNTGSFDKNSRLPGSEFTTDAQIKTLTTDTRNESHGTHTIGIGAGSYDNTYRGMAPKTDIVACGSSDLSAVNIINSIAYVFNKAKDINQPAVVNLSIGYNIGAHDGLMDAESYMIDKLAGEGKIVVVAAGNEGDYRMHIEKTMTEGNTEGNTIITSDDGGSYISSLIDIWTRGNNKLSAKISVVDKATGKTVYKSTDECSESKQFVSASNFRSFFNGTIALYFQSYNGKQNVFVNLDGTITNPIYRLKLTFASTEGATVDVWTDTYSELIKDGKDDCIEGTADMSINTMACGFRSISVGSYNNRKTFPSIKWGSLSNNATEGKVSPFSSWGPAPDGRKLPTILGPGHSVVSSFSNYDSYSKPSGSDYQMVSKSKNAFDRTNIWGSMSGTSMATPAVAGIIATWLQADPTLTPERIKEIFEETAIIDSHLTQANAAKWGYGKIDSHKGLLKVLQSSSSVGAIGNNRPVAIFPNPSNGQFSLYAPDEDAITVNIYNIAGAMAASKKFECSGEAVQADFSFLQPGTYVIQITGRTTNYNSKIIIL